MVSLSTAWVLVTAMKTGRVGHLDSRVFIVTGIIDMFIVMGMF